MNVPVFSSIVIISSQNKSEVAMCSSICWLSAFAMVRSFWREGLYRVDSRNALGCL